MNKRTFLNLLSAAAASPAAAPLAAWMETQKLTNWAGNLTYGTDRLREAASVEQIRSILRSQDKVKVLGTRHCFNAIADSRYNLLSLKPMHEVVALDLAARTVTVDAGITYGQLCPYLDSKGFALHNLASLPHISVAGAGSTATHGSGEKNGNLATAVSALEIVTAAGDVVKLSRKADGDFFAGAVVGLGALGAIARITLDIQPTYMVRQYVYEDMPLAQIKDHFDRIQASGYSVSLFTDWQKQRIKEVWIKSRVGDQPAFAAPPEFFGAKLATRNLHPIAELSAENCTEQMGVPGPGTSGCRTFAWVSLPAPARNSSRNTSCLGQCRGRDPGGGKAARPGYAPHLLISEIRTIAADDLWMSTCYKRPSVTIHFTWKPDWPAVKRLLPVIERELSPFQPRPHWGKLFTLSAAGIRSRYERLGEFIELATKYDPKGKFRNDFLNTYVFTR
jgi:alditol oxidase